MKCPYLKEGKCPILSNQIADIHECGGYTCDEPHYVYIVRCNNNTLYTGQTNNIDRRIKEHKAGKGAKYTKIHGVKEYTYIQCCSRGDAMKIEYDIKKKWNPEKKSKLFDLYGIYR